MEGPPSSLRPINDPALAGLAKAIHAELSVPEQNELLQTAVEAGYYAALADGEFDADERKALIRMALSLSDGLIVEWEVEALLDEADASLLRHGAEACGRAVGERLAAIGCVEIGLLVAAYVALASHDLNAAEVVYLKGIGEAAGLSRAQVADVVKRANTFGR